MVVALVASNSANNLPVRFRKKKCHISDSSHQVRGRRYCIEETSASVLRPKRLERCGQTMADVFHVRLRGLSHALDITRPQFGCLFERRLGCARSARSVARRILQRKSHLLRRLEAELLIQRTAEIAGVQAHFTKALLHKPVDHGPHQSACYTASAVRRLGVHVQNRRSSRLWCTRHGGPGRNDNPSSPDNVSLTGFSQPGAIRSVLQCGTEIVL